MLMIYPKSGKPATAGRPRSAAAAAPRCATATDQCVPEEGLVYEPASLRYAAICGSDAEMSVHPWAWDMVPPLALGVTV
jgi:hypothetical protein